MAAIEPPIIRFEIEEPPPTHADQHQEIQYIKRKKVVRERTHHGRDEIVCRREEDECVHCKAEEANKLLFTQMEVLRVQQQITEKKKLVADNSSFRQELVADGTSFRQELVADGTCFHQEISEPSISLTETYTEHSREKKEKKKKIIIEEVVEEVHRPKEKKKKKKKQVIVEDSSYSDAPSRVKKSKRKGSTFETVEVVRKKKHSYSKSSMSSEKRYRHQRASSSSSAEKRYKHRRASSSSSVEKRYKHRRSQSSSSSKMYKRHK